MGVMLMAYRDQHISYREVVRERLQELSDQERRRSGADVFVAHASIAAKARVSPGTVTRAIKGGHKEPKPKLIQLVYRELMAERMRAEHHMQILQQTGMHMDEDQMRQAEFHLAELKKLMG